MFTENKIYAYNAHACTLENYFVLHLSIHYNVYLIIIHYYNCVYVGVTLMIILPFQRTHLATAHTMIWSGKNHLIHTHTHTHTHTQHVRNLYQAHWLVEGTIISLLVSLVLVILILCESSVISISQFSIIPVSLDTPLNGQMEF